LLQDSITLQKGKKINPDNKKEMRFSKSERNEMTKPNLTAKLFYGVLILTLASCAPLKTNSGVSYSGSSALVKRPDFDAARLAAPSWVNAALDENTALRAEVKELKLK
jgi:hypothetical protein